MNNIRHKMKLMDFYLYLLSIQYEPEFDLYNLMNDVNYALAKKLDTTPEIVERIFERMAAEDAKF